MVLGGRDPRRHEIIEERVVHGPIAAREGLPDHDAPEHLVQDGARLHDALGNPMGGVAAMQSSLQADGTRSRTSVRAGNNRAWCVPDDDGLGGQGLEADALHEAQGSRYPGVGSEHERRPASRRSGKEPTPGTGETQPGTRLERMDEGRTWAAWAV